jgi:hypothetical protein
MYKLRTLLLAILLCIATLPAFSQTGITTPPRYLGKRATDPATCSTLVPTWYWNTASLTFRYCSAANTFADLGGGSLAMGSTIGSATQGSVLFAGASGALSQNNANFFWDDTNKILKTAFSTSAETVAMGKRSAGLAAIWMANSSPSSTNWVFSADASTLVLKSPNSTQGLITCLQFICAVGDGDPPVANKTLSVSSNSTATYTPLSVKLAASQSATAFEVLPNGSSTPIFAVMPTGITQSAGNLRVSSNVTNATTTLANATGLVSPTLTAGRTYSFYGYLYVADSTAADGVKIAFDAGTATATNFRSHVLITDSSLRTSSQVSALATTITAATITGDSIIEVSGTITVNAAGTFGIRQAQNAHTAGTLTVYQGSYLVLTDIP